MSTRDDEAVRRGIVRDSLGVGIATGVYGVSFGAISVASGLSIPQTCLLSLLMFLKLVFAVFLLLAQPRFVQNKGLVLLTLTSLVCNIVAAFLQGIVPIILVSITDALAAIVFAIVAIVWAIVLLIGSIPGIVRALQTTAEAAGKRPMQLLNPVPALRRLISRSLKRA